MSISLGAKLVRGQIQKVPAVNIECYSNVTSSSWELHMLKPSVTQTDTL